MLDLRSGKHVSQKRNNLSCRIWEQRQSTDAQAASIDKEISSLKFFSVACQKSLRARCWHFNTFYLWIKSNPTIRKHSNRKENYHGCTFHKSVFTPNFLHSKGSFSLHYNESLFKESSYVELRCVVQGGRHRQGINHVWERKEIYKNFNWKEGR